MSFKTRFNFSEVSRLEKAIKAGIRRGLQQTSIDLAGRPGSPTSGIIKQEMSKPKSGRAYTISRGGRRRIHIASNSSGQESSAVLTGRLRKSVRGRLTGSTRLEISANTPYAGLQERGGKNSQGNKVSARNNIRRPIRASRRNIVNNIDNSVRNNLR